MTSTPRPLAVTMGDPAGIGLDITLAAWCGPERATLPPLVLLADPEAVAARARALGLAVQLHRIENIAAAHHAAAGALAVLPVRTAVPPAPGRPDTRNAAAVIAAIELATAAALDGSAAAVVTNPIAKATLTASGFPHPGHTEFLAELAARHRPGYSFRPVMMLAADELRVVPLTVHMPLAQVPAAITAALIEETVRITAADLTHRFGIARPRIAVAGLNPHAGEGGTLGREEIDIIAPAIAVLCLEGFDVTGPYSGDTLFHGTARARYDVAVAMYHDQALIPLKTLAFDRGVNVTLGLPFIRTSPDHGTAFDIAGTGRADPTSFVEALRLAARMAARAGPAP